MGSPQQRVRQKTEVLIVSMLRDCRAAYVACIAGEPDDHLRDVRDTPCIRLRNWEEIKYEISLSNVIQRDSAVFAKKLAKKLYEFANEKEEQAKNYENLWEVHVRRNFLLAILDQWVKECGDEATVGDLLEALSIPGFMDVKL